MSDLDREKPHIVMTNKGNPHKIWCCMGHGDVACDNTPELAYRKWHRRVRFYVGKPAK